MKSHNTTTMSKVDIILPIFRTYAKLNFLMGKSASS